jgi:Asp-tRNA(Asn)/Glu-tRNA(Gln) amidotransferase A subunit family amidase
VPAGYIDGLPVGLQIAAPAFEEGRMLGVAHAYEQATRFAWNASPKVGAA